MSQQNQLWGSKRELEDGKWLLTVNTGYNLEAKRYDRKYKTFYGNSRQAAAALRDFIDELENPSITSSALLDEWLLLWLEEYAKPNQEKNTFDRTQRLVKKNIIPFIGHIPIGDLTTDHVQSFYTILSQEGKIRKKKGENGKYETIKEGLAPRTIKYVHTVLNQALNEAVVREKIPNNPAQKAKPHKDKQKAPEKWVVLNAEQLNNFLQSCQDHRDYALIYTAAYTGARQSELLGLTWDKVFWDKSSLRIDQALHMDSESEDGFEHRPRTKNHSSTRTIRVSDRVIETLRIHQEKQFSLGIESNLVFTEQDGTPMKRQNLGHRYYDLATRLEYPGMTFHHLRHTHATILLSNGAYINAVAKRLGHADPKITLSTYGHCLPEEEETLVTQFDKILGPENV